MTTGNARIAHLPTLRVTRVAFSLLSSDEKAKTAVCEVTHKDLNIVQRAGDKNTLYDRRMGPTNETEHCSTCNQVLKFCPGHFGIIRFPLKMLDPEYGKEFTQLMGAFCNHMVPDEDNPGEERLCLQPLVIRETIDQYANLPAMKKWRRIVAVPKKICAKYPEAHAVQSTWTYYTDKDPRAGPNPFRLILKNKVTGTETIYNPGRVQMWLARHVRASWLSGLGLEKLGNPEKIIIDALLVLPNTYRLPTTGEGTQGTVHDDLTQIYSKVVGANEDLKKLLRDKGVDGLEPGDKRLDPFYFDKPDATVYTVLCSTVLRFYNNKDNACREAHASKAPKGANEMIDSKEGLWRQQISAGRSGNTARTVIVSDADIRMDEVGIPFEIMEKLVTTVAVTTYNIATIKELAKQGKIKAIKGGPNRTERGDVSIDTGSSLIIPDDVAHIRALISEYEQDNGEEPGKDYLMEAMDMDEKALEELVNLDIRLQDEEQTRAAKVANYIDSIAPGDEVERTLMDGDPVIMSRQPILRKNSMMGHKSKGMPGKAIRLADGSNQPYNADNDGDEMNIYVPQGIEATAETLKLMYFSRNVLSEQGNRPLVGLIQDALLAAMLLTSTVVVSTVSDEVVEVDGEETTRPKISRKTVDVEADMSKALWSDCVARVGKENKIQSLIERCERLGINPYSGRGLVSILFPVDFVYTGRSPDKNTPVEIRAGILVKGTLSQMTLNTAQNSIHHELILTRGPDVAVQFLTDIRRLCHRWMEHYGYTLGSKDITLSKTGRADIERVKQGLIDEVKRTQRAGKEAKGALSQHVEADVLRGSNNIMDQLSAIVIRHLNNNNGFLGMVDAGSKGSKTSITQMLGIVGQITIEQVRPALTLSDRTRTDLHYPEDDPNPSARGLCATSYEQGLSPSAMIFQGMATHQASYDISVHTGDTGYSQRKLVLFSVHLSSQANGSVTNSDGSIVQFRYGSDGLSPSRILNIGGKTRFINVDSVIDSVKLEVAMARMKGIHLPPATRHFLSSFEETKIIQERAFALRMGSKPYLEPSPDMPPSEVLTADAEFEEGLIPDITVYRRLASGENAEVVLQRARAVESTVRTGL